MRKESVGLAALSAHTLHLRLTIEVEWVDQGFIGLKMTLHSVIQCTEAREIVFSSLSYNLMKYARYKSLIWSITKTNCLEM